jgi:glycosyltransferase involved in cell wall biosynthesis
MTENLDHPDVSIIICTRNRAAMLRDTLDFYRDIKYDGFWELIVVDNLSTDDTKAVVAQAGDELPQLRYIEESRIGLGAARDRAWREARAPILIFTDDDCYPLPDFIDRYRECFNERPDIDFIGGKIYLWDPEDYPTTIELREVPEEIPPYTYLAAGKIQGANFAFRKVALERIGGFDPELGAGTRYPSEDIDAAAAAVWAGMRGRYDPRPLVYHHHRRKHRHLKDLHRGYDWGRGAYHMKYLLRPESRNAHLKALAKSVLEIRNRWDVRRICREVQSAFAYAIDRRRSHRNHRGEATSHRQHQSSGMKTD